MWDYLFDARPIRRLEAELEDIYAALETAEGDEQNRLLARMTKVQAELDSFD